MANPVVRWQIVAGDVSAVTSFYSKLFGWSVDANNSLGYRELRSGEARGIDGGVWPAPAPGPAMVQLFVEVDDVQAHLDRAVSLGAKVLVPRTALPDGDVMALFIDVAGLSCGLVQRRLPR
jgi:predicted enzyme related to lactoylglutathione lyase